MIDAPFKLPVMADADDSIMDYIYDANQQTVCSGVEQEYTPYLIAAINAYPAVQQMREALEVIKDHGDEMDADDIRTTAHDALAASKGITE